MNSQNANPQQLSRAATSTRQQRSAPKLPPGSARPHLGPDLDIQDSAGGTTCALASPADLTGLARRPDPGLTPRHLADAGRQIDLTDDDALTRHGLTTRSAAIIRERLAAWPRTPQAAAAQPQARHPAGRAPGRPGPEHGAEAGREPEPGH